MNNNKQIDFIPFALLVIALSALFLSTPENIDTTKKIINESINVVIQNSSLTEYNGTGNLITNKEFDELKKTGINELNYTNNSTYYPYYTFLNDSEKTLYKQAYTNIEALETTFTPVSNITIEELNETLESVYNDHPELFWLNTNYSYKYTEDNKVVQITLSFNETINNIDNAKNIFNTYANMIINNANKFNTNYEKEKYVHDTIIRKTTYNENAPMNQSAYSALVNGQSVCAGYSRAFQYIMIELGIPTYYVTGTSNEDHAWNIIALDDGYYNVDLTWDDSNNTTSYYFFNLSDLDFASTHTRTILSNQLPKCYAKKYSNLEVNNYTIVNNHDNTYSIIPKKKYNN